jgi:hypothetical protein
MDKNVKNKKIVRDRIQKRIDIINEELSQQFEEDTGQEEMEDSDKIKNNDNKNQKEIENIQVEKNNDEIQEQKIKYVIHDSVQLHTNIPYFFQNGLISEKVYLAQNTNTIKKAIEIGKTWKEDGYNIAEEANDCESQWKITLYKYINSDSIVPYKVSGISNKWDIRIMGYKINGVSFFTVLLHLSYNAK